MNKKSYNQIAGQSTERIIGISDGIFAVALTLLVLEIRIPVLEEIKTETELLKVFVSLYPKFLVYFLAFMTAGIFWMGHSAQYKVIEKSDRNLNWINLLFLLCVTMLPFSTAFLGDYIDFKLAIFVYWMNIFLMGLMLFINWNYAYNNGFVSEGNRALMNYGIRKRIIVAQSLYFLGLLLCFISSYLSIAFIIIVQLNYAFPFVKEKSSN
ncbi:MAG: TMEM175 family protein [Chitinophagales bacterium]|nr:TMEM175 family protein [Chitinophagales bacterium]